MKRAEVFKHRADQVWIVEVWGEGPFYRHDGFPAFAAALAHARRRLVTPWEEA